MDENDKKIYFWITVVALLAGVIIANVFGGTEFIGIPPMIKPESSPNPMFLYSSNSTIGTSGDTFTIKIGSSTMTLREVNGTIVIEGAKLK